MVSVIYIILYMNFSKNIRDGRRTVEKFQKNLVLVTFQVDESLREDCNKKTSNLSEYLRRCMEKLSLSKADKEISSIYDNIIEEAIDEE